MAETPPSKSERKRERQPISVPFIWEEKPGMPKKDWKPTPRPIKLAEPPIKLVVSVPFGWEEKPGTPLHSSVQPPKEPKFAPSQEQSTPPVEFVASVPFGWEAKPGTPLQSFVQPPKDPKFAPSQEQSRLPVKLVASVPFGWEEKPGTPLQSFVLPPKDPKFSPSQEQSTMFSSPQTYSDHDYENWSGTDGGNDDRDYNEGDGSSDSEIGRCSCDTDDSFISAQSLLANGLISTAALSNAVPVQQTSLALTTANSGPLQSPGSPASEAASTASSYATGTTSLVGASFLEWLFPLLAPKSSFPDKVGFIDKDPSHEADMQVEEFLHESNSSQVRRPLLTLGELIVMSRRRSCQRKVNKMHKQPSMDFMKRNAFGCCIFGSGNGISGLHMKWKRQFQLKLM